VKLRGAVARGVLAGTVSVGIACAMPAASPAVVTVGSDLEDAPTSGNSCGGEVCTVATTSLVQSAQATGGLTSPVNGVVTSWRVKVGLGTVAIRFRILHPAGGGQYTGAGTSDQVTPPFDTTTAFTTQLPISAGDLVGLNCCASFGTSYLFHSPGPGLGNTAYFFPPGGAGLLDGATGPPNANSERELLVSADIQPTAAFASDKPKSKKGGKVLITASLPNPGTLTAGDRLDQGVGAAAAARRKPQLLLKRATTTVAAAGTATLVVKPTKSARSKLTRRATLKAGVKLSFTPTGGSPSTQIMKVKLKR
jgi:hypothetical protein